MSALSRRKTAAILAAVALPLSASAQPELSMTGYLLNFPSYMRANGILSADAGSRRDQCADITRIRLRPAAELWNDARLSLEFEFAAVYNSLPVPGTAGPHQNPRQVVDLTWHPAESDHFTLTGFVDRLYFKQGLSWGDIVVGRQRISWGTGRVWNPTDLFCPISPTTYAKIEKDGVDAAMVKFRFGDFTDLSLVYNPQKEWKTGNAGFRFRSNVSEFDVSLMGGSFDRRTIVGGDFAGNFFDAGVRGEALLSAEPGDLSSNFVKLVFGADYQFTRILYGLLEYQFNGEGATATSSYQIQRLLQGEILNVGRTYLAAQASVLVHPLVTVTGSWIANLDDGSQFLGTSLAYSAGEEFAVAAGGQVFLGRVFTEYWYYPLTLYMKIDVYF